MHYKMKTPCKECPFLLGSGFTFKSLTQHASGQFACHKACDLNEDGVYESKGDKTPHCAGALIFLEKQNKPHQMMRIAERLGMYDMSKLDMAAPIGSRPSDYPRITGLRRSKEKTDA